MTFARIATVFACSYFAAFAGSSDLHKVPLALELKLNDLTVRGSRFVAELGIQVEKRPVSFRIGVRNINSTGQTIDLFKSGNNVEARWSDPNDKMGLITRSTLNAGEEQTVIIRLLPTAAEVNAPTVTLSSAGAIAASIAVSYRIDLAEKTRKTGGAYWSPLGLEGQILLGKAHYKLCTGAAPLGYHLNPDSIDIHAKSERDDHPRNCGLSYMECRPEPVEDGDVCYDLYIQGHWKAANLDHDDENDAIKVDVDLQATYVLDGSTFRLLAVDSNDSLRAPSRQSIR